MERSLCPGEIYRHFKGRLYQIVAVASHSETGEKMVVYQALYGDFAVYVRPYDMFVGKVDREKYPQADQEHRFEWVSKEDGRERNQGERKETHRPKPEEKASEEAEPESKKDVPAEPEERTDREEEQPKPALMGFLDAESFGERIQYLKELSKNASQSDLDSIYVVLDMRPQPGSIVEQLDAVNSYLTMQQHFDGGRLR